MKDDKLKKLKKVELNILLEFDRVCSENNINYSIGFGTLLGAIRHKGFIPWDDDIDIMMPLADYLRFEEIAPSKLKEDYYFQSRIQNPYNYVYWNRIGLKNTTSIDLEFKNIPANWGICIDIFPMFPISDNLKMRKKELKKLHILNLLSLKYYHIATFKNATFKEKIKKLAHLLMPKSLNVYLTKRIINYFKKYNFFKVKNCLEIYDYSRVGFYKTEWFKKYERIEFENHKFMAIKEWDEFLKTEYGDYMTPPKDKSKHSDNPNVLIDFNNSYLNYLKK